MTAVSGHWLAANATYFGGHLSRVLHLLAPHSSGSPLYHAWRADWDPRSCQYMVLMCATGALLLCGVVLTSHHAALLQYSQDLQPIIVLSSGQEVKQPSFRHKLPVSPRHLLRKKATLRVRRTRRHRRGFFLVQKWSRSWGLTLHRSVLRIVGRAFVLTSLGPIAVGQFRCAFPEHRPSLQ